GGVNGRNDAEYNQTVAHWPERYQTGVVGGSDAHTLDELGKVPTQFTVPVHNRTDLIRALKEGWYRPVVCERFS
ncbi:MAG: hypothetical protein D3910_04105, partial [Candidatus Electrothrix sp. ATG2]|nr:hypothetical protein [Candidatus Electrothrix sp. ATG2]